MLEVSQRVKNKILTKHAVTKEEVYQCFSSIEDGTQRFLKDNRDRHNTEPPTLWFIGETYSGRKLKICFIIKGDDIHLKTAYAPNEDELYIYNNKK